MESGLPRSANSTLLDLARDSLADSAYGTGPNVSISITGAMGVNAKSERRGNNLFLAEEQRGASTYVQLGLVRARYTWRQAGWRAIAWGFAHQGEDGSIESSRDTLHSAAMFIEAAGRSLLLEHQFGVHDPHGEYRAKLIAGARWFVSVKAKVDEGFNRDSIYTHRGWISAAAIGIAAELGDDDNLRNIAASYAEATMSQQRDNGINPELGGFDVGYQATGIIYASRYYTTCKSINTCEKVRNSISGAAKWLSTRILENGFVDASGSSRIFHELGRDQKLKRIPYGLIVESLALAGLVTDTQEFRDRAFAVTQTAAFKVYYSPNSIPGR